ncbi:hypothetical protein KM043_007297 [Ampulex compressa]|nr:hypothetical protein KM043_007297 [Ampulex compressa]
MAIGRALGLCPTVALSKSKRAPSSLSTFSNRGQKSGQLFLRRVGRAARRTDAEPERNAARRRREASGRSKDRRGGGVKETEAPI